MAAARQRAGAQEDRMEVASPSPRPWRLLGCEGPPHAGLGFSAWARPCAVGRLGEMSGVTGGWCVDRGGRVRFIKVATPRIAPRSGPRTVEAARRPQFVSTARRAPGEDWSLRSTVCRHQESRESSDEHEVAPCRVRARGLPHASRPRSEPEDGLHRSASRRLLTTPAFPRWSLVALDPGATHNKLGSTIVTHLLQHLRGT